jgi:glutathione S-transferase
MKLYYSKGACSLAVRITLHEIGILFESEAVNLKTKKTEKNYDFLKINPKGAVPALLLDNKEILTENAVIQQFLADQYQDASLLPPINNFLRYRTLEWFNFISTELHKNCAPLFNQRIPEDLKNSIYIPIFKSKLNFAEQQLSKNKYIAGEHFSIADSYLFVVLIWLYYFDIELSTWEAMSRYFERLKQRPSIEKALQEEKIDFI